MSDSLKKEDKFFLDLGWFASGLWQPIPEIIRGYRKSTLPLTQLLIWASLVGIFMLFHFDYYFFKLTNNLQFYPGGILRKLITVGIMWSGFWLWGVRQVGLRRRLMAKLTMAFINADLVDKNGRLPGFVLDEPIDRDTRRLRIKNVGLVLKKYQDSMDSLEAGLGVKVIKIEVVQNSNNSLIDMVYTYEALDKENKLDDVRQYPHYSFPVGISRAGVITSNFIDVPHLLIGGTTGTGKSTWLKMLATVVTANNPRAEIVFIDPKGSESAIFEDLSQVRVIRSFTQAKEKLLELSAIINYRNAHFKENKVKDLIAYNKLPKNRRKPSGKVLQIDNLSRIIVIVDEISDFMRNQLGTPNSDLSIARQSMTRIAQMGRSSGVHIVVGVQNPDKRNIDMGLKANLIGTICFSVRDFVGSTIILGNKRACDLPTDIKGRAIWQVGGYQQEVQVPYLSDDQIQNVVLEINGELLDEANIGKT